MTFTMTGRLSVCAMLVYRVPFERVRHMTPPPLELLTRDGWAFWAVVMCRIERMRPLGAPRALGIDYAHVAHRLYVRTPNAAHHGLYFLRSDVDSRLITLGDCCTDFRMHHAPIDLRVSADRLTLRLAGDGAADVVIDRTRPFACEGSIFDSVETALQHLKYSPQGLAPARRPGRVRVAEVLRDESQWHETPVRVERADFEFMKRSGVDDSALELATVVDPIDYRWRLGRTSQAR